MFREQQETEHQARVEERQRRMEDKLAATRAEAVSYTHLTLPTKA